MSERVLIGMEVHLQLRTKSKMFCRCPVRFGAPPNQLVCPVCLGMPGTLPVPNREAMIMALSLATALGCTPAELTKFDRKNYFYPDLPKGYQISQYDRPLATGGAVEIVTEHGPRHVRLIRLHIEEDVGKSLHEDDTGLSRVEYNRAGTPLVEIVSEPDLVSAAEARAYLNALRTLVRYLDISGANMQEGNLRCEPNVNLHIDGVKTPIVEIKNLNSVRHVERAIEREIERQRAAYAERGAAVADEPRCTVGYDEDRDRTYVMREKEEARDYRYFPEPDIPPILIGKAWLAEAAGRVPELPVPRRHRFREEYGLSAADAESLCRDRATADYFEKTVAAGAPPQPAANWVRGEVRRIAKESDRTVPDLGLLPARLAALVQMVEDGRLARTAARGAVLPRMIADGTEAATIVEELGLAQVDDADVIRVAARRAVEEHPSAVSDFRAGKERAMGALIGFVMKETQGKANPKVIRDVLRELMETA